MKKTLNAFSSLPIDHAHEQNNKSVKGDRGVIGLTENMSQLLRWMVAGPEIAHLILEFEASQEFIKADRDQEPNKRHHEQAIGVQCLPVFHAFTGYDQKSCFGGRGKNTALEAWKVFGDVTSTFNSAQ